MWFAHKAVGPHRETGLGGILPEQVKVEKVVGLVEEYLLPAVASLSDV